MFHRNTYSFLSEKPYELHTAKTYKMIKWGIIGTGKIAFDVGFAIQSLPTCQITAVSSRKIENAKKYAQRLKVASFYDDYDHLIGLDEVDIIYISTPNSLHAELIESGLNKGKHILCEKPMTIQADRLIQLKELAAQKQLFLMEAMWTLFLPSVRHFLKETQKIGHIRLIQGSMGFSLSKDRCFRKDLGGGCILDLGVYLISLTYAILGQPNELLAQKTTQRGDVETSATISMKYKQAALAQLMCSFDVQLENSFTVYGEKGAVKLEAPFYRTAILSFQNYSPSYENIDAIKNPFDSFSALKNGPSWKQRLYNNLPFKKQQKVIPFAGNGYQYQIIEVLKCLKNNQLESSIIPIDHSIQVIKIINKLNTNENQS